MIIEDERNTDNASDIEYEQIKETIDVQISHEHIPEFLEFIERHVNIRDGQTHDSQLQSYLNYQAHVAISLSILRIISLIVCF
jgi:hypothetical protein